MIFVNLYQEFHLDPAADCEALGVSLAAQEVRLQQLGHVDNAPQVQRVRMAYGILSRPEVRRLYDDALAIDRPVTAHELEYLADFGSWPLITPPANPFAAPQPQAQPPSAQPHYPVGNPFAMPAPGQQPQFQPPSAAPQYQQANPFAQPAPMPQQAPYPAPVAPIYVNTGPTSAGRIGMTLLDSLVAWPLSSMFSVVNPSMYVFNDIGLAAALSLNVLFSALFIALYFVGTEVWFGGTPAKLLCGYRVQDQNTGKNLSWVQSMGRNWWRLVAAIPFAGQLISIIVAIVYSISFSSSGSDGAHDRAVGAEVVRKLK